MPTKRTLEKVFKKYNDIVSIKDIQQMLGIGKNLAYRLVCEQEIESVKAGKKYIIAKDSVIEYLIRVNQSKKIDL